MMIYLIMFLIGDFIVWPIIFWIGLRKARDEAWGVGYMHGIHRGCIETLNKVSETTEKEE